MSFNLVDVFFLKWTKGEQDKHGGSTIIISHAAAPLAVATSPGINTSRFDRIRATLYFQLSD